MKLELLPDLERLSIVPDHSLYSRAFYILLHGHTRVRIPRPRCSSVKLGTGELYREIMWASYHLVSPLFFSMSREVSKAILGSPVLHPPLVNGARIEIPLVVEAQIGAQPDTAFRILIRTG